RVRVSVLRSVLVLGQKREREMVKQRFLTHFKPWLFAVFKAAGLILAFQAVDQIRSRLQYAPLDIIDVVTAASFGLLVLAAFCAMWAWGEWFCFKLRCFRSIFYRGKQAVRSA